MKEKKNLIINKKIIDESINLYYNINNISKLNLLRLQLQVFISKHHGQYSQDPNFLHGDPSVTSPTCKQFFGQHVGSTPIISYHIISYSVGLIL
jgi:hypothetical protein